MSKAGRDGVGNTGPDAEDRIAGERHQVRANRRGTLAVYVMNQEVAEFFDEAASCCVYTVLMQVTSAAFVTLSCEDR
jgi:hypothetical protein